MHQETFITDFTLVEPMCLRRILPLVVLTAAIAVAATGHADIVVGAHNTEVASHDLPVEEPVQSSPDWQPRHRLFAVPEPATFGMISLGLALGGGLLVRNKRPA